MKNDFYLFTFCVISLSLDYTCNSNNYEDNNYYEVNARRRLKNRNYYVIKLTTNKIKQYETLSILTTKEWQVSWRKVSATRQNST